MYNKSGILPFIKQQIHRPKLNLEDSVIVRYRCRQAHSQLTMSVLAQGKEEFAAQPKELTSNSHLIVTSVLRQLRWEAGYGRVNGEGSLLPPGGSCRTEAAICCSTTSDCSELLAYYLTVQYVYACGVLHSRNEFRCLFLPIIKLASPGLDVGVN